MSIRNVIKSLFAVLMVPVLSAQVFASEASLVLPDLRSVYFFGITGHRLLAFGLLLCLLGLLFGFLQFKHVQKLPVHKAMKDISELIYETCKTYLLTQGKFLMMLELFLAAIIVIYFGWLMHFAAIKVVVIVLASIIGILGSYSVAWFGMRINTFANSRTAFASLRGLPYPTSEIR